MLSTTTIRRLARWIVGLFVIAQIFAVAPLISEHTAHVAQSELGLSDHHDGAEKGQRGHHRGDSDGAIQHHEVQDLSGALICTIASCEIDIVHAAVAAHAPVALTERDPPSLERPPKTLLSA